MAQKLRAERALKDLTQSDVAKYLGISLTAYASKERGEFEFTVSEAKKLCELFGKKFEELF